MKYCLNLPQPFTSSISFVCDIYFQIRFTLLFLVNISKKCSSNIFSPHFQNEKEERITFRNPVFFIEEKSTKCTKYILCVLLVEMVVVL